jgi:hypothetical protein
MSNGYRNQHHLSYVYAGERYSKDAVRMIVHAPHFYLGILPYSFSIYLHSANDYEHTLYIRAPIDGWDTIWNRLFYGQWQKDESLTVRSRTFSPDHFAWWLALGFLLVITAAPLYLWRQRADRYHLDYGLILFMFWNIVFISAAGILLDIGENNRTRFGIDPFLLLLGVFFLRRLFVKPTDRSSSSSTAGRSRKLRQTKPAWQRWVDEAGDLSNLALIASQHVDSKGMVLAVLHSFVDGSARLAVRSNWQEFPTSKG